MTREPIKRSELIILALCVVGSVVLYATPMIPGFGEPDAARLAILAAEWHETGQMASYFYEPRTSPSYIHTLKILLDAGLPMERIPAIINWFNVLLGGLVLIPIYYLWRALTDGTTALIGCALVATMPGFWTTSMYGMPLLPAYALFVTALLLYWVALHTKKRAVWLHAAAVVLAVLAVSLKADIVLCYGAFLALAYYAGKLNRLNAVVAIVTPVIAVAVATVYTRMITPAASDIVETMGTWRKVFPLTIEAVMDEQNRAVFVHTAGRAFAVAILLAVALKARRRDGWKQLAIVLAWALPPVLFWGMRMGNSARHMTAPYTALMLVVAMMLMSVPWGRARWAIAIGLIVVNVALGPYDGRSVLPSSRPDRLKSRILQFQNYRHSMGELFAAFYTERKLYVGAPTNPYVAWEGLAHADSFEVVSRSPLVYRLHEAGKTTDFRLDEMEGGAVGPSDEWFIFTFEHEIHAMNRPKFERDFDRLMATARHMNWRVPPDPNSGGSQQQRQ